MLFFFFFPSLSPQVAAKLNIHEDLSSLGKMFTVGIALDFAELHELGMDPLLQPV